MDAPSDSKGTVSEVSLDDIDALISQGDPDFVQSVESIRQVASEAEVEIESSVLELEGDLLGGEEPAGRSQWLARFPGLAKALKPFFKAWSLIWGKLRTRLHFSVQAMHGWLQASATNALGWLRSSPVLVRDLSGYILAQSRQLLRSLAGRFYGLSKTQRAGLVAVLVTSVGAFGILIFNLRGVWLPIQSGEPLHALSEVASQSWQYEPGTGTVEFLRAFPAEEFGFAFPKMVVNLKRSSAHPNPMGFFEFYVRFDSRDAAIEAQSRQRPLSDLLQRTLEEIPYEELEGSVGRRRFKEHIREELNRVLNHGWAIEVLVKNMVLKP